MYKQNQQRKQDKYRKATKRDNIKTNRFGDC